MKISILLPVFNAGFYLSVCLKSIVQQTESDWELLAVNDFSTDDSADILKSFAEKDNRIRVFQNTEKGIVPALRLAFKNSTGQLITRMDADDVMPLEKLAVLKSNLLKNGQGHLATGCVQYFKTKIENFEVDSRLSIEEVIEKFPPSDGYLKYANWLNDLTIRSDNFSEIYKECVIPSPCWMVFKEDLIHCGAFDDSTYPEDYDLCFRFYKHGLKVIGSEQVLHYWRDHSTRSSRTMEVYANNNYFNLKLPYFLALEYDQSRPLVLWGAGKKGKKLARMLEVKGVPYHWLCNNSRKWGIQLYGARLESFEKLTDLEHPQVIVAVGSPDGKREILEYFKKIGLGREDYCFF
jgi:glycosyltransferase involved in cell wall biosynthesis